MLQTATWVPVHSMSLKWKLPRCGVLSSTGSISRDQTYSLSLSGSQQL